MTSAVVIPNWNGREELAVCLDSLAEQTEPVEVIVVENGSTDGSVEMIRSSYPGVTLLVQPVNLGFAGGVNVGLRYALHRGHEHIALLNNDAVVEQTWLAELIAVMRNRDDLGMVASKFVTLDGRRIDSTGECYSTWGLPYPRGRDEEDLDAYDDAVDIFGGSGGSTLYRAAMLRDVGLFDEDFFAYFEDIDLSWRAQLRGWRAQLAPPGRRLPPDRSDERAHPRLHHAPDAQEPLLGHEQERPLAFSAGGVPAPRALVLVHVRARRAARAGGHGREGRRDRRGQDAPQTA